MLMTERMRPAKSTDDFMRAPAGTWVTSGTTLLWCHSPTLFGLVCWGSPNEHETAAIMRIMEGYPNLAPRFDALLDASAVERVEPTSLEVMLAWMRIHFDALHQRLRARIGVIPPGLGGLALAGITPLYGGPGPVQLTESAREGFRLLLPDGGDALCDEVTALMMAARGTPPWLLELRALLAREQGNMELGEAARQLGMSTRSLQRALAGAGTSYRNEQGGARFRIADELLGAGEKLSAVAARLGVTDAGLARLVRARTGLSPGEHQKRRRDPPRS